MPVVSGAWGLCIIRPYPPSLLASPIVLRLPRALALGCFLSAIALMRGTPEWRPLRHCQAAFHRSALLPLPPKGAQPGPASNGFQISRKDLPREVQKDLLEPRKGI